jgi:heme oxygenase (biliverdin-producing, ferredoxin)
MLDLKNLTWEHHKNAERQAFVKEMFGGNITNERYATYLYNQFPQYDLLEAIAFSHGLFNDMPELRRSSVILEDFYELWPDKDVKPQICPVVEEYIQYLKPLINDPDKIMAHVYVRHMGDLSGGQMIAKRVPGEGRYYKFNKDTEQLKTIVRSKLNNEMAEEAKVCFDFATKLFQQLDEIK